MNPKTLVALLALFGTGLIAGYFVDRLWDADHIPLVASESRQVRQVGGYQFINPLLECEVAAGTIDSRKQNFRPELERFVEDSKSKHGLTEMAVLFRDLNNGPSFGVDDDGQFFPASLLKVPVMMAYYYWSQTEPGLLDFQIPYPGPQDFGVSVYIEPRIELVPGESYTVEQLIEQMILYSDNQALHLLVQRLPKERIEALFKIVGVGDDVVKDTTAKLTVREYAGFFRILFNSSYLSRLHSEQALELLSRTEYHDALPGPLPQSVKVAHKFGEAGTGETERQLHDCGIVYFPDHPYLACIMTRGKSLDSLKSSIQDVSKFIYDKVDEQY